MAMGKKSGQDVTGYAAHDSSAHLVPFRFSRRATGPDDVTLKVLYCGICHSDLHQIRNEWGASIYPMVPGHEVVGAVTEVGENVKKFKVGDKAGVGCMVDSCRSCVCCGKSEEQYCDAVTWTYNSMHRDGSCPTFGGYSSLMVVDQKYALRIPDNLPLDAAAPLLCAGITVYSPMKHFGMMEKGKHLGVVGLGGLGHVAIKLAKKMGLVVTLISTSPHKEKEAREVLGVDNFLLNDNGNMVGATEPLDFILDTVSATHPLPPLLNLLKVNGGLVLVGIPEKPLEFIAPSIVSKRRFVAGSCIGGIEETQEMLDFCGKNNIVCTIEKIPMDYVNKAMERLRKGDVKYRFVLDIGATLTPPPLNGA